MNVTRLVCRKDFRRVDPDRHPIMPLSSEEDDSEMNNTVAVAMMDAEISVTAAQQVLEMIPAVDPVDGVVADPPPVHAEEVERCIASWRKELWDWSSCLQLPSMS